MISACKTKDGAIKLIDKESGQGCPGSQQLVEWNQQGPAGTPGVSGYEIVYATSATTSNADKTKSAICPSGKQTLGGGAGVYGPMMDGGQLIVDGVGIVQSHPFNEYGWGARAREFVPTDNDWYLAVWVVCADVS